MDPDTFQFINKKVGIIPTGKDIRYKLMKIIMQLQSNISVIIYFILNKLCTCDMKTLSIIWILFNFKTVGPSVITL